MKGNLSFLWLIYGLGLLIIPLYPLLIYSQIMDRDLRASEAYFESGNYQKAKLGYEGLLDSSLESWKKQILSYNIGTALLAEGHSEEAVLRYQALLDEGVNLPLLEQRTRSNLVLSRILLLDQHLESLKKQNEASHDKYAEIFMRFHQIRLDMEKAKIAWCNLEKSEGANRCSSSHDLAGMQLEVKMRFNSFLDQYFSFRLNNMDLPGGILILLIGEKSLISQLLVLQQHRFEEQMKGKYLQDYLEQAKSWKILWDKLIKISNTETKGGDGGKQKETFDRAHQLFLESLHSAEQGSFSDSFSKLESSKLALNHLLHQFFNESSPKDVLKELLATYELTLIRRPLQEVYLDQLLEIQTTFKKMLHQSLEDKDAEDYEMAQKYLKLSVQSFADFHPVNTQIFAEVARFYIKNIAEKMDFTPKVQASEALENVIAKEEFILLLGQLRHQSEGNAQELDDVDHLLSGLQLATIKAADRFPEVAIVQQKTAFNAEETKKSRCQCHPWDEVIPLFSQGYAFAELASHRLENQNLKHDVVEGLQRKAVDRWKEALAKMRSSPKSNSSLKDQQQEQAQNQPEDQEQEKQQQNKKLNDILKLVQDMEKDDHSKPLFKTATGNKGDERPW